MAGRVWIGLAGFGMAGRVRTGQVGLGQARLGLEWQERRGQVRYGTHVKAGFSVWQVWSGRLGKASRGKAGKKM